jgi:hypothetical protein
VEYAAGKLAADGDGDWIVAVGIAGFKKSEI